MHGRDMGDTGNTMEECTDQTLGDKPMGVEEVNTLLPHNPVCSIFLEDKKKGDLNP